MTLKYLSLKLRSSIVSFFGGPAEASLEGAQGVEGLLLISMYIVQVYHFLWKQYLRHDRTFLAST